MDIIFEAIQGKNGSLGVITLNRPTVLNALTHEMSLAIDHHLQQWEVDQAIKAVLIKGNGEKAFCAGGDIRHVYQCREAGSGQAAEFFYDEYQLNRRIAEYPKPYIALLHGITMGGGAGVSLHGSHRIAADNVIFSMPETGIGFFPDVGSAYFLSRCPYSIGIYLGLTAARIGAFDMEYLGLVDAVIPSNKRKHCYADFIQAPWAAESHETVMNIINTYKISNTTTTIKAVEDKINHFFSYKTIEDIMAALQQDDSEWANETRQQLINKSPLSLKVTLEYLHRAMGNQLSECLETDFILAKHFLQAHDFYEGIRAILIDKDKKPRWLPARLDQVTNNKVEAYFK